MMVEPDLRFLDVYAAFLGIWEQERKLPYMHSFFISGCRRGAQGEIPPEGQTLCSKVLFPKIPYVLCPPPKPKIGFLLAYV